MMKSIGGLLGVIALVLMPSCSRSGLLVPIVVLDEPDAGGQSDSGTEATDGSGPTNAPCTRLVKVTTDTSNKVDILFDIDNSASMGDKQGYLKAAIPDLVNRLINPNCVDSTGASKGPSTSGACPAGLALEFPPVHDMHVGIISTSLGARGGDACGANTMALPPFNNVLAHNDDKAHLLNRTLTYAADRSSVAEGVANDAAAPDPYLYWFPSVPANAGSAPGKGTVIGSGATFVQDFTDIVGGVGVFGCGIESQLESWYRFLVQPDPYDVVATTTDASGNKHGTWSGVDQDILQERADFLRPDSLVIIVDLSDEDDSEIDVRSIGGLGVNWMAGSFQPPNATAACTSNPGSASCQSCAQSNNGKNDSQCRSKPVYSAINDWGFDLNLRHVHMKEKYGVDPQFPMSRYVNGLTSTVVPDRSGEYPNGGTGSYVGMNDCVNPLFATNLPSSGVTSNALCKLTPGPRSKELVVYAHIGGVPHQLLHFTPGDPAASALTSADWVKILGNDPEHYDYSGIDPHMIEDYQPRKGIPGPGSANDADPISGHDWITDQPVGVMGGHVLQVDRQYACIFPLSDETGKATPRDCTLTQNANSCDCPHLAGTVNAQELPPICDQTTTTQQIGAKAYPTIRELELAKLLGSQGVVSSICPIHVADNATHDDPLYGYRPALEVILNRVKCSIGN